MTYKVFEPTQLAGIPLNNKIIRSATHEGMSDERGYPTEQLKKKYIQLAKGEVGAIITGFTGIQQNGKAWLYRMQMIDEDDCIAAYRHLMDAIHEYNTPIIMQIAHCGRQTRSKITGKTPIAPSALKDKMFSEELPHELSEIEIEGIIDQFVQAIGRAQKASFDGAQLHAAHGTLLSEFLSPYMNRRQDKWGGNTQNRFRIVQEIYQRSRKAFGDFPILIKMNAYDGRRNGMRLEEAAKIAELLERSGCSAIEVSCGVIEDGFYTIRGESLPLDALFAYHFKFKTLPSFIKAMMRPFANIVMPPVRPLTNYNVPAAQTIKANVSIPVIVVGGIRSLDDLNQIILNQQADMVSMCRPFIIEPDIVKKLKEGRQQVSKCISCNYCFIAAEERPLQCYYGKLKPERQDA
jgi:2,4-dienoyl-CoA reductase-like NADH-dependent reductase (Old Yellow Enzyme family)